MDPEARELLVRVGQSLQLDDEVRTDMTAFVLSNVYAKSEDFTCGQARASKWHMKMKKKSTIRLPPDHDSHLHLQRTNYITYCHLHYQLLEHPSPIGHGWAILNGTYRPVRHNLPSFPQQLTARDCSDDNSDDSINRFGWTVADISDLNNNYFKCVNI